MNYLQANPANPACVLDEVWDVSEAHATKVADAYVQFVASSKSKFKPWNISILKADTEELVFRTSFFNDFYAGMWRTDSKHGHPAFQKKFREWKAKNPDKAPEGALKSQTRLTFLASCGKLGPKHVHIGDRVAMRFTAFRTAGELNGFFEYDFKDANATNWSAFSALGVKQTTVMQAGPSTLAHIIVTTNETATKQGIDKVIAKVNRSAGWNYDGMGGYTKWYWGTCIYNKGTLKNVWLNPKL